LLSALNPINSFRNFYETYSSPQSSDNKRVGQAWFDIVSGIEGVDYRQSNYEMASGIDNEVKAINYLLGTNAEAFTDFAGILTTQKREINITQEGDFEFLVTINETGKEPRKARFYILPKHSYTDFSSNEKHTKTFVDLINGKDTFESQALKLMKSKPFPVARTVSDLEYIMFSKDIGRDHCALCSYVDKIVETDDKTTISSGIVEHWFDVIWNLDHHLRNAAKYGAKELVPRLLEKLDLSFSYDWDDFKEALEVSYRNKEMVELLLGNSRITPDDIRTLLGAEASIGNKGVVMCLLERKEITADMINEALVEAAKSCSGREIVALLLERSEITQDGIRRALKSCDNEGIKVSLGVALLRKKETGDLFFPFF